MASRLLLVCVLLVAGGILACGDGDGNGDGEGTPTRTPTASRVTNTSSPTGGDEKTPEPEGSPNDDETPNGTATPVLTPAAEGTPAVAPSNQAEFIQQFAGRGVDEEDCIYNPPTRVTDCAARGRYAVDPPPAGEDVTCTIGILDGKPEYIRCVSQQPLQAIYYDVQ